MKKWIAQSLIILLAPVAAHALTIRSAEEPGKEIRIQIKGGLLPETITPEQAPEALKQAYATFKYCEKFPDDPPEVEGKCTPIGNPEGYSLSFLNQVGDVYLSRAYYYLGVKSALLTFFTFGVTEAPTYYLARRIFHSSLIAYGTTFVVGLAAAMVANHWIEKDVDRPWVNNKYWQRRMGTANRREIYKILRQVHKTETLDLENYTVTELREVLVRNMLVWDKNVIESQQSIDKKN